MTDSEIAQILSNLKSIDLSTNCNESIVGELKKFKKVGFFGLNILPGQFVLRSRPNDILDNEGNPTIYYYEKDISYIKDPKYVPPYNRASLEGQAIFYGCINDDDERFCQVISGIEVSNLANSPSDGQRHTELLTMGKWRVKKKFHATAFVHHQDYRDSVKSLKSMHDYYLKFLENDPENANKHLQYSEFIASEFAKEVSNDERFNYRISAIQTNIILSLGIPAVVYPSVKGEGRGFNIAIHPQLIDDGFIELEKVSVWRYIQKNKKIHIHPYLYCDQFQADGKFIYQDPGLWTSESFLEHTLNSD